MRAIALGWMLLAGGWLPASATPPPAAVAILYNSASPESRQLAEFYQQARAIPPENLIALEMPLAADISRDAYEATIAKPLRATFDQRGWWKRSRDASGLTLPASNRIQVLVTVRGVPLRILPSPKPVAKPADKAAAKPAAAADKAAAPVTPSLLVGRDDASVDSELSMIGVEGLPLEGILQNKFYQAPKEFAAMNQPFLVLTARIDAPSLATCQRMIRDAVETESTGLWGMAYVDIANKFPQGDQWLEAVAAANVKAGIPTVVDRFNDSFPKNYPMRDASLYFGWYDWNVSGPFLNPRFAFRKGAVAMHLHSFSAQQLANPSANWCAPLLDRGAAVTVGNVFEPYLHLTHDFALIQQRLLAGDCWVEACWKAMPVCSWQGVVLGDPLYQPFKHLDGGGLRQSADNDFRALRSAALRWSGDPAELRKQLDAAAQRTSSSVLAEAAGLNLLHRGQPAEAAIRFRTALRLASKPADQLRQDFHLIAIDRTARRKDVALRALRDALKRYGTIPEAEALKGWIDILDPPPPPLADPTKTPAKPGAPPTPAPKP